MSSSAYDSIFVSNYYKLIDTEQTRGQLVLEQRSTGSFLELRGKQLTVAKLLYIYSLDLRAAGYIHKHRKREAWRSIGSP